MGRGHGGISTDAGGVASTMLDADLRGALAAGKDTEVCFEQIETCRNNVGIASILFVSFSCASEQRTSYFEVTSDSVVSMQSLRLVPDAPTDEHTRVS